MVYNTSGEDLIGPRSDERGKRDIEGVTSDGVPVWMVFLEDPDAPTISPDEVHEAKNAFKRAQEKNPDVVSICRNKTMKECKDVLHSIATDDTPIAA